MNPDGLTEARRLLQKANEEWHTTDASIGFLIRAVEVLIEEHETHQHSYIGPSGLSGQWYDTMPARGADDKAHEAHLKASRDKHERKS